ncbi:MAG TPA: tetratricopeptide repeat protein [Gemmatimonadales bacterium]|nr:tetratricopeptide repeat protein [Gemmatimonadales bacterium]
MYSRYGALAAVGAAVLLLTPAAAHSQAHARDLRALDSVTSGIMTLPVTTASVAARNHFLQGQRELDLGRTIDANAHFKAAVAADSNFAIGYLNVATTGNSLAEFNTNLALAERHVTGVTDAERILIQIARLGASNDINGQLVLAQQLVAKYPDSPRAYLVLGGVQGALNQNTDARVAIMKAVSLAPRLLTAHTDLGNSYLFGEPKDFAKSLEQMQRAAALAPNEPFVHDLLGDVYRAQNNLERARAEYTRGHELAPTDASLLQQRGHVNSFAGNFAAARADYDSAIALGRANEQAGFSPFRAYVSVYAGEPKAAIAELNRLVAGIDTMGVPEPRGVKIAALTDIAVIAIHTGDFPAAVDALKQRTQLLLQQADQVGTAAFRRSQEANIAYFDAWVAARQGDYTTAARAIDRVGVAVTPDANPRKLEPVHELKGYIALYQGNFAEAAGHFAMGNLNDPYIKYQYAVALAGGGEKDKAQQLFRELAVYNFNNVGYALIRKDAQQKAASRAD